MGDKTKAAMVLFFDPCNKNYMICQSTNWHPVPAYRHLYKGIGGVVEDGESTIDALKREIEEELPGWFLRIPGTSRKIGSNKIPAADGISVEEIVVETDKIIWSVRIAVTDIGIKSFHQARACSTESNPVVFSIGTYPDKSQCIAGFYDVILAAHSLYFKAFGE